jgi:hypothetical protein
VDDDDDVNDMSLEAFQARKNQQQQQQQQVPQEGEEEFDGYVLRDILLEKWDKAYDALMWRLRRIDYLSLVMMIIEIYPQTV